MLQSNLRGLRQMMRDKAKKEVGRWGLQRHWKKGLFGLIIYFIAWPMLKKKSDEVAKRREEMERRTQEDGEQKTNNWAFEAAKMEEEKY